MWLKSGTLKKSQQHKIRLKAMLFCTLPKPAKRNLKNALQISLQLLVG